MRTIKFRAWHKQRQLMLNVYVLNQTIEYSTPYRQYSKGFKNPNNIQVEFKLEEVELMQFTGLHDKNGKEIYEGDIVQDTHVYTPVMVVKYEDCWFFAEDTNKTENNKYPVGAEKVEIIGNIYENPELLN